jgi:Rrf2 family protein
MQISARADYGVRAMLELASREPAAVPNNGLPSPAPTLTVAPVSAQDLAEMQAIPVKFLEAILTTLRKAGLLVSTRGAAGGFSLAKPSSSIMIADIIRALDGPLASVRGHAPEGAEYTGSATHLRNLWVALRASMREVLETVTLRDIVENQLPPGVLELLKSDGAWERR